MKVLCQMPLKLDLGNPAFESFAALFEKESQAIKNPDTELILNPAEGLSDFEEHVLLGLRFLNDKDILKSLLDRLEDDIDGVIMLCSFDPGLWAARQMLDIPVTGLSESTMHLANLMGRKFAILAGDERYIPQFEEILKAYDMRGMAIEQGPVRAYNISEMALLGYLMEGDLSPLVKKVKSVAEGCIKDGADVLIIGCGITSVLLTEGASLKEIDGVPIVDPIVSSIKFIEMLIGLNKSGIPFKSKRGLYWRKEISE